MKNVVAASVLALGMALGGAASAEASDGTRYLVMLKKSSSLSAVQKGVRAAGGEVIDYLPQVGIAVATSDADSFAGRIGKNVKVQSVMMEPLSVLPDTGLEEFAGFENTAEAVALSGPTSADVLFNNDLLWGIERVNAPDAWALAGADGALTGEGATVAVIDTGVASNHPDLAENLVFSACYSSAGFWEGAYEAGAPCNPYPSISDHGTHVAGTVAAAFGGGQAVGVAPNAKLASYNIFELINGRVSGYTSSRWQAMTDAADRGFDVINMSLGYLTFRGNRPCKEVDNGLCRDKDEKPVSQGDLSTFLAMEKRISDYVLKKGTVIVSSAGNDGLNTGGTVVHGPGDTPGQLNVAATGIRVLPFYEEGRSTDAIAFYSNVGPDVDVAAPGGDCGVDDRCALPPHQFPYYYHLVLSTTVRLNDACAQTQSCAFSYGWKGGTSMAAPHVAGVAAIASAAKQNASARQIANDVKRTAEKIGSRQVFGHGMVDALAAAVE